MKELDFTDYPPGTVTEYTTLVCLTCTFDIFTKQIGLAPSVIAFGRRLGARRLTVVSRGFLDKVNQFYASYA